MYYQHAKGGIYYKVWDVVHKETLEPYVVYRAADIYCRTLKRFNERFRSIENGQISDSVKFPELQKLTMEYAGLKHFENSIMGFCLEADTKEIMVILEPKLILPWRQP